MLFVKFKINYLNNVGLAKSSVITEMYIVYWNYITAIIYVLITLNNKRPMYKVQNLILYF